MSGWLLATVSQVSSRCSSHSSSALRGTGYTRVTCSSSSAPPYGSTSRRYGGRVGSKAMISDGSSSTCLRFNAAVSVECESNLAECCDDGIWPGCRQTSMAVSKLPGGHFLGRSPVLGHGWRMWGKGVVKWWCPWGGDTCVCRSINGCTGKPQRLDRSLTRPQEAYKEKHTPACVLLGHISFRSQALPCRAHLFWTYTPPVLRMTSEGLLSRAKCFK